MADITIKDLAAGTPSLTDLTIMANPITGIAKRITFAQINGLLNLADLADVQQGTPPANSILEWDGGFSYVTNVVRASGLIINRIPFLSSSSPYELTSGRLYEGNFGIEVLDDVAPHNLSSAILNLFSTQKGFLKPRMSTDDRIAIASPATGLEVYDTTLNLPYYYNGSAWATAVSGITTLNTLTALTQTFAVGSAGTDFAISSATATHTFNIPTASATARGLLSSANWTTFNSKVGGSGTANNLAKFTAAGTVGNSLITDDGTTLTLPAKTVINGSLTASAALARYVYLNPTLTAAANNDMLIGLDINPTYTNGAFTGVGNIGLRIGTGAPTTASKWGIFQTDVLENNYFAGKVGIGSTALTASKLLVNGTGEFIASTASATHLIFSNSVVSNFNINSTGGVLQLAFQSNNFGQFGFDTPSGTLQIFNAGRVGYTTPYFSINGNPNAPEASAVLDVRSTTKGSIPLPRMTTVQIKAIASPINGLMAYSTDDFVPCFFDGNAGIWKRISHSIL